jgi:hypothetical protein
MLAQAQQNFGKREDCSDLLAALPTHVHHTLRYMIYADIDMKLHDEGLWGAEAWSFMGPAVVGALVKDPELMVPQVVLLGRDPGDTRHFKPSMDTYEAFFGENLPEVLGVLRGDVPVNQSLEESLKDGIRRAQAFAREL